MLTVSVLGLLFGICLVIASLTSFALKANENHQRRVIERTPLTPIAEWRAGRQRIAGGGVTAYGPGGPVRAPITGIECAWWAIRLVREPARNPESDDPSQDILLDLAAQDPPALTDETGSVLIDPAVLTGKPNLDDPVATELSTRLLNGDPASTPPIVPYRLIKGTKSHETLRLTETRLEAGKLVYALGTVGRARGSLMLRPARHAGFTVLTTDNIEKVRQRRHDNAVSSRHLARFLGWAGLVVTVVFTGLTILFA